MKKCLAIIVAMALVAPAMAASVTVSAGANDGEVVLTADAGIVGIGLTVDGDDVTAVAVDSFFDIFIDSAFDLGGSYNLGDGIPTATQGAPGEQGLPSGSFSISVGGLDDDGIGGGTEEAPLSTTIVLSGTGTVTVDADMLRGGIVGYDGAMTISGLPLVITLDPGVEPECMKNTHPDYLTWVGYGKPDCWCYAKQCKGDVDGLPQFGGAVDIYTNDTDIVVANFGTLATTEPGVCADIDHGTQFGGAVNVYTNDLDILLPNFGAKVTDCDMTHFNFWITP